ncbi:UDP:flavonoid glycosyltransferase YjiC, YdhE family [Micromonospora pallida]|uniref:UDP:flavonoid glycosyltransferase YjiC, YdhE family n=1 Tax=Micromonospora pallida TaxID=145854 RepID=A0A1C6TCZ1_9ACTN|nr:glycosyltransferase [Micromonospora pallida]SCL39363.1 UDP:flavonoid glycosyltransferase YjiC, YdhE family [Micromonospora pallida]
MRILIVTAGSRGDVAPFTGLGQRLQQAGHQVALAAHDRFADLVRDCGLEYRALPGDPVELVRARTAAPSPEAAGAVFAAFLDELGEGVLTATAAGTDILLTAFGPAPLSRVVAEGFGIPSLGVYLAPGVPTREFPPPGWPDAGHLSPADNLAAGRELLARTGVLYADVLRRLRARLDLPASTGETPNPPDDWLICHGYSSAVVPRPTDWPTNVHVTGYWWPAGPPGWQPPDLLVDFLQAGPPPVFVGFGSMTPTHERLHEVVAAAVKRAGVRAVVQSGWAELGPAGDDTLLVGDLPHDWLFPRTAAVVHHAGAGTTGAGLRAGVPALPVPVLVDQPFWADRLHRLGVAPPPLPIHELTTDTLTDALRSCLGRSTYRDRATELAHQVRADDGPAAVLSLITQLDGERPAS